MKKPILHLMVGLPCSGKSTYAKQHARQWEAVVFSPDDWQLALFGDDFASPHHDFRHDEIEKAQWDCAKRLLSLGGSVVLDFGFWSKEERASYRAQAEALGAGFQIHYMEASLPLLKERLEKRLCELGPNTFQISFSDIEEWVGLFEPPSPGEVSDRA